jgi:hypothetical protein
MRCGVALFSKKSKIKDDQPGVFAAEDEIFGFLDEIFQQRSPLSVRTKTKHWDCSIYFLDVNRKILRIEDSFGLLENDGKPVLCGFSLDRTWYQFQSKINFKDGKPHLLLPKAIKMSERRKKPRAGISPREQVNVTILQSLGAGVGFTGVATDIGPGGICLKIDRALKLESQKEIKVRPDLIPKGTQLMIVKVKGVPGVPTFECQGITNRISGPGTYKLALKFAKLPSKIEAAIENFVNSRYHPPRPLRRSYKKRQEMQKQRELEMQEREQERERAKETNTTQPDTPAKPDGQEKPSEVTFVKDELAPDNLENINVDPFKGEPIFEETARQEDAPPSAPAESMKPMLLSLGTDLVEPLGFLADIDGYEWIHVGTPMKIIKHVRERKSGFLFLPPAYKRQSMLEYLEKMSGMGVLQNIDIVLMANEPLAPKDMIKARVLGIQHIFELPLQSSEKVIELINAAYSLHH